MGYLENHWRIEVSSVEHGGMSTVFYMVEQFDNMGVPAHFSHGMVLLHGNPRRGGTSSLFLYVGVFGVPAHFSNIWKRYWVLFVIGCSR